MTRPNSTEASLRQIRRELHAAPELSTQEYGTAATIKAFLDTLGLDHIRTDVGGAGILAVLKGGKPGVTTMLRADMDALPIQEETGAAYASKMPGVMHACGHDAHMSILMNAARVLAARRADICGTLVFCFQPAEEGAGGAQRMIADRAMEDPCHIDRCFALHVFTGLDAGLVGIRDGAFFASVDQFSITLHGRGGHGANPHQAVDPIMAGAHLVTALQTIVSRELPPKETAVVSLGRFVSGSAFNIIPESAVLEGTVRCFDPTIRKEIRERMERIVNGVAETFRVKADFSYSFRGPPLVNDPATNDIVRKAAHGLYGVDSVIEHDQVNWAEDMALMQEERPGAYFLVGAKGSDPATHFPHHSPFFEIDETCLDIGCEMMVRIGLGADG